MKNRLKSKTMAVIGIVMYAMQVGSSVHDAQGKYILPIILPLLVGMGMVVYVIMAILRLWKQARLVSLALMLSNIMNFILGIVMQIGLSSVIVLYNLSGLFCCIALFWAIITLFQSASAKKVY